MEIMRRQGVAVEAIRAVQPQHHVHDVVLLYMARMLVDRGGIPTHGNQHTEWDAGCRFDFPNPDYR
jgi:hypothetical protein